MRISNSGAVCMKQAVNTAARRRRWKRKAMLVLTDVSGPKQLSVLSRSCCLLAPCRRGVKRPYHKRSTKNAAVWESTEEVCDGDETERSNAVEQDEEQNEEEENNTESPPYNTDGKVNGSLTESKTQPKHACQALEANGEGECQQLYTDSFALNGIHNGESSQDFIDDAASLEASTRLSLTAVNIGNEQAVVLMSPSQKLTFQGRCRMTCLYGSVEVLGFTIGQGQPAYCLYSLPTHTALSIEALPHCKPGRTKREMKMEVKAVFRQHVPAASRHNLIKEVTSSCSVLLFEHLDTPGTVYLSSFPEYREIFTSHPKKLNSGKHSFLECSALTSIGVIPLPDDQGVTMSDSWIATVQELLNTCLEDDDRCPIILVCGGKNFGKSTFSRYLLNSFLNHIPCVEFLELDLGQTEFSPPGCMALHLVTEPILGPPYMHQCEPRKMVYYGDVSCERDLDRYLETAKYLYAGCKKETPLVINTMGWVKGFGLSILVDLIRLLAPTHVVQLGSAERNQDPPLLTPEFVQTAAGWQTKGKHHIQQKPIDFKMPFSLSEEEEEEEEDHVTLHGGFRGHRLMRVQSEFPGVGEGSCLKSRSNVLRELALLGYFSELQPSDTGCPLLLHSMLPYQVPFSAVALHVLHCDVTPTNILYAANASLVGLCRIPDVVCSQADGPVLLPKPPLCDCFGIGIIRGINLEKRLYYILTPVPVARLKQVNCLLIGAVTIPHSLFRNQPEVTGELPYVTTDYSFDISGAGKIKVCKQLRRREHHKDVS
ncbi:polynucleotide 5'-hydroxyl-kinase NOL9 isoform X1 [Stegostoma tigrinum]|uniref:polynucleotide 5'-hydroxyl-kinase NOL9 isoform X1 n=1 Tax=Stegostoma tigrinum TaxID=3053191 RepID=UPI00202B537E|nr:polynucleotide 5'-hydroxyl-kinase NOL9 isoform X1 [Stegostoma tigrinum]XP_048417674.1 polynucleotide 5'-hydroxyl-kinase NOL9 isoform X1 [Stegostoma tigrinum]XP_048417676.1 polynucleotide 5'-hydroxyl-kinase NOL9 isoform X1 [Stegostoma tigrinum]XP_048417677.1 polynucleotide 5'-hydroxyl-kinase NOL9 isoform X1 [Stegostoma tigrinum]